MRLAWPRSLAGRLLGIAALSTLAALAVAGVAIGGVLERFVLHALDDRLDAQIGVLARAVRPDGSFDPARAVTLPSFGEPGSGWQWQVRGPTGRQWTSSPGSVPIVLAAPDPHHPHHRGPPPDAPDAPPTPPPAAAPNGAPGAAPAPAPVPPPPDEPVAGDGRDAAGDRVHLRQLAVPTAAGPVLVTASGPRSVVERPLREALVPLLLALGMLGAGLGLSTLVQLRLGLAPLRDLGTALGEVRAGRRRHVPTDLPTELAPLAVQLNALIDQNEAGLAHARRHVANLAHGLKTPLAALAVRLGEDGRDPDGSLADAVARIDRQVRHHLGRARAAAPGGTGLARTPLAPAIADLLAVLARIHAERPVTATGDVADALAVAIDPQDLDEMLGNLLDNAWRHARSAVRVTARESDATVIVAIEDDGPGLSAAAIDDALVPGRRLDERGDGHGFGLPIAQELAELNGGALALARSATLGGLAATLTLPRTAPREDDA